MSLQLSTDHPTFTLKTKIQAITQGFFASFGFSYFQFLRCFSNGAIGLLTNHTGLLEYFQHVENTPVVFSSFENEHEEAPSYWFLWDSALPEHPVSLAREKFRIHNGLTLVRRARDYYDMIAVALPFEHPNPGLFYINKIKVIEQFINDFEVTHVDLIRLMNRCPIQLPEAYRDVNYRKICLDKGKIVVKTSFGETHITAQELACLRLYQQGLSHKKIAQELAISPRTVETYMLRVRRRVGLSSRSELERLFSFCSAV